MRTPAHDQHIHRCPLRLCVVLCGLLVVCFVGCMTDAPHPVVAATPTAAAVQAVTRANAVADEALASERALTVTKDAAEAERLGKLKANVVGAHAAVNANQKLVAQGELTIAESRLADVQTNPEEAAETERRKALVLTGRLGQAEAAYKDAAAQAEAKTAEITLLKKERDEAKAATTAAQAEAKQARSDMVEQAERDRIANQKKIDDALSAQNDAIVRQQVTTLTWLGAGCAASALIVLALGWIIGGRVGLRKTWPVSLMCSAASACCFEGAQLLGVPWLKWAIVGTIIVALGIWFWRTARLHEAAAKAAAAAKVAQDQAAKYLAFAKAVIPVLDTRYDNGSEADKQWMDTNIFDPLSASEDATIKATVHDIRAQQALEQATNTTSASK